jgi:flagellar protein FliS
MAMQNIYNYQKPKVMPTQMNTTVKKPVYNAKKKDVKADQYLEQKIMSAKPEELTLMLYEGMVKFLKQGILYNDQENVEKTHNAIMRTQAIINELNVTLKEEYEVSGNLRQMYAYMNSRLIDANLEKQTAILEEVLEFAEELRDTWKEAMTLAK